MGYRLAWTETLGAMADFGPLLQLRKYCSGCRASADIDLNEYAAAFGWDFTFWDWEEACEACGEDVTFLASPGPGTPLLPMRTEEGIMRSLRKATARSTQTLIDKGWTRDGRRWIAPDPERRKAPSGEPEGASTPRGRGSGSKDVSG